MFDIVVLALAGITALSVAVSVLFGACVHVTLSRRRPTSSQRPPLTILKPLKGLDDQLYENLASIAGQDYPSFEIIFGTEDPRDPALEVARRVQREFPEVDIKIVTGAPQIGFNPKVSNLAHMSRYATHDLVLVSDSNVRARPDYLASITAELEDPRVGLVHNVLVGTGEESLGATFENLHLASFVVAAVSGPGVLVGRSCVIGKSMLLRLSDLAKVGGWHGVRNVLAEDYLLGERFARAGLKVVHSPHVLATVNVRRGPREFFNRHLRWGQMRRWIAPGVFLSEGLLNPIPGSLALIVLSAFWRSPYAASLALAATCGLVAKLLVDASVFRRLRGAWFTPRQLMLVPLKDLLVFGMWCVSAVRRTIVWRGNVMLIGPGSELMRRDDEPLPLREVAQEVA